MSLKEVSFNEGRAYANEIKAIFQEISPLNRRTIYDLFEAIGQKFIYDNFFYIPVVGDNNVGKTCLLKKILNKNFDLKINKPAVTMSLERYYFQTSINEKMEICFLDTNGSEESQSQIWNSIESASAFLIVFDVNNKSSFDNIIFWLNKIKEYFDITKVDIIIVANKCDLERKITSKRIENFEKNNFGINYIFYETSALTGEGIEECLEILINKLEYTYENFKIKNVKIKFFKKKKIYSSN